MSLCVQWNNSSLFNFISCCTFLRLNSQSGFNPLFGFSHFCCCQEQSPPLSVNFVGWDLVTRREVKRRGRESDWSSRRMELKDQRNSPRATKRTFLSFWWSVKVTSPLSLNLGKEFLFFLSLSLTLVLKSFTWNCKIDSKIRDFNPICCSS